MVKTVDAQELTKVLGRHTRLGVTFDFVVDGNPAPVDLQADGYTARVWVNRSWVEGAEGVTGPNPATVEGTIARYHMSTVDLDEPSPEGIQARVQFVCVVESAENTIVSDARSVTVGDWQGADTYAPV